MLIGGKFVLGWYADSHIVFFAVLFCILKPIVGFKSWWHAIGAAAMSGVLYLIYHALVPGDIKTLHVLMSKLSQLALA